MVSFCLMLDAEPIIVLQRFQGRLGVLSCCISHGATLLHFDFSDDHEPSFPYGPERRLLMGASKPTGLRDSQIWFEHAGNNGQREARFLPHSA